MRARYDFGHNGHNIASVANRISIPILMDQFLRSPQSLTDEEIEGIEKQSLRALFVAACNLGFDAYEIFRQSTDSPKDIGEDTTREMMERLGGYNLNQRILGNVDYRRAHYIVLPELSIRQALFVDSKAEKDGSCTATLQMSQLSMKVTYVNKSTGDEVVEKGHLKPISSHGGKPFLTTTLLVHYEYELSGVDFILKETKLAAIPNGKLQHAYNPDSKKTIWQAGRQAPSLGEDFRVRLNFARLSLLKGWRVQSISYDASTKSFDAVWKD